MSLARVQTLLIVAAALALSACATAPAPIERGARASSCGAEVEVQRGDTLGVIAQRCGTTLAAIAAANGLSAPYTLHPGQRLRLGAASQGAASAAGEYSVYTVRRGDNLYRIALAHGMTIEQAARLNNLSQPYTLRPGQQVRVTGPVREVAQATGGAPTRTAQASSSPTAQTPARQASTPASAPSPTAPPVTVSFRWPAEGPVVRRYQEGEGRMDGIRIAVPVGSPVYAAADGEVVYADNEIRDYGELILVRHADRVVTAYGLNSRLRVTVGQQVRAGEHIADAGAADASGDGVLHFEIRRGVSPVDPLSLLPRRAPAGS